MSEPAALRNFTINFGPQHAAAHGGQRSWNAEVRTCPHNLFAADHFDAPRHDEWHRSYDAWVRREP